MFQAPDYPSRAPSRVAVLPFDNESTSLRAPDILRALVQTRVSASGYGTPLLEDVDSRLKGLGVTDGGQLRRFDAKELGKTLEADGLLYGVVEEFAFQNLGFFQRRVVRLRLKLVASDTGERLWESVGQGEQDRAVLKQKEAMRAFILGLAEQALEGALGVPLMPESQAAVGRLFDTLPRR